MGAEGLPVKTEVKVSDEYLSPLHVGSHWFCLLYQGSKFSLIFFS